MQRKYFRLFVVLRAPEHRETTYFWKVEDHNFHHVLIRIKNFQSERISVGSRAKNHQIRHIRWISVYLYRKSFDNCCIILVFDAKLHKLQKIAIEEYRYPDNSFQIENFWSGSKRGENCGPLLSKNMWFSYAPEHARQRKVPSTFVGPLSLWIRHGQVIKLS